MKKLWTACYSRSHLIPPRFVQVQTSRGEPKFWSPNYRMKAPELAPSMAILEMSRRRLGDWRDAYQRQLQRLHDSGRLAVIVEALPENAVLMCYESNPSACHRSILARFLTEQGLATVEEIGGLGGGGEPTKQQRVLV